MKTEEDEKAFAADLSLKGTLMEKKGKDVKKEERNEDRRKWVKQCVKEEVDFVLSAAEGTAENLIFKLGNG
jgi:hypothetical protein